LETWITSLDNLLREVPFKTQEEVAIGLPQVLPQVGNELGRALSKLSVPSIITYLQKLRATAVDYLLSQPRL
jgi:hypothetical protein